MSIPSTQRTTKELPLLILSAALVCGVCIPLWQWTGSQSLDSPGWTPNLERASRLLLGPEQIACYCCFVWGSFIMISRYVEVSRQRSFLHRGLLPTEEGSRILPEDSRPLLRRMEQLTKKSPSILANMIKLGLGKYAITRSSQDVSETVRTQAEVDQGRLVASLSTLHYLAWALPALGFLGTVRGLSGSLSMANHMDEKSFIPEVSRHLTVAFDCTLVALVLSLVIMFFLHSIQRDEESLVIDCRQYCQENLVNRLYNLDPVSEPVEV